ncbi:uncharacterized protein LOC128246891 [Mya arenaria]|uniref:uncharacterized protein LOC128246891 n=1 Tax=Mya arenaria TaxID=6604 RepID=UPI0022E6AC06|nr:uncharacterized protein LOC128202815 isoform X3 [Mya arenaria]XP_052759931.1 uncharacterized protein LOC128202815 isoform X3 [Mya arenaria]XP_052821380.1 uncharacterized protein LOC128246891 [Mya arenaria]XP_052821381.1 uncharacterized protein LOC128246891 [Mya arenaria]
MVYYKELLKHKESQNWFKASVALRIAQRGLQVFIDNGLRDVQKKIFSIAKSMGCLSPDTNCTNCTTENLILCPTRGICTSLKRCKFHNTPRKCLRNCPQQLCHLVRDGIIRYHRFSGPSWKNTKAEGWHADHWEIGKCYLPPDGYKDVSSSIESDFNALINVLINCTEFETKLSIDFTSSSNLLTKIREYGRNIRHSPDQKMKDIELNNLFQKLTSLLEDSVCLQTDSEAVSAVKNLKELQNDKLVIRVEDEQQILFEGLQMRLAKYYQRVFNSSLLCSLLPNRDSNPDKLFVTPKLIERDHRKIGKHGEHLMRLSVTTYRDIFFEGSSKCSNVYLIGEPGMGKTTLTIKCCLEWSAQHLREEGTLDELTDMAGNGHISFADADIFKDIDFVFRIALKEQNMPAR